MANERDYSSGTSGITEQIKQDSRQKLESTKRTAADQIDTVAQALDSARARLNENQPTLAAYAGQIATGVSNLATRLREGSMEELLEDTRRLARRNPALFLAGGVALGFALSRFLKASAERAAAEESLEGEFTEASTTGYPSGSERVSGTSSEPGGPDFSRGNGG